MAKNIDNNTEEIFEGVYWYNGMFISLKHLKDLWRLQARSFNFKLHAFSQNFGIEDLSYKANHINDGIIQLQKALCLMKNGDIVDFDISRDTETVVINLNDKNIIDNQPYTICIAVVNDDPTRILDKDRCFVKEVEPIFDSDSFNQKTSIKRIKIKPYLLLKDELDSSFSYLPILKIVKKHNIYHILEDYIPPVINILSNKISIFREIQALIEDMISKTEIVNEKIRMLVMSGAPSLDAVNQIRSFYTIVPGLSKIYAFLQNVRSDPRTLFIQLTEFTSVLSLVVNKKLKFYSNFNEEELLESFNPIISFIKDCVNTLFLGITISLPFEKNEIDMIFQVYLSKDYIISNGFYIAISSDFLTTQNIISIAVDMIIASSSNFEEIKRSRIKGANRNIINDRKLLNDIKIDVNNTSLIIFVELNNIIQINETLIIDIGNKYQDINIHLIKVNKAHGIESY